MKKITKRKYRNEDFDNVFQFMSSIYEVDWRNGVPAPFFEYAQGCPWTDVKKNNQNALWEDDQSLIGFCFFDFNPGKAYFNIKPGYEEIAPDMLAHAEQYLCDNEGGLQLKLFNGQRSIIEAAQKCGYTKVEEAKQCIYNYIDGPLDYKLPLGFSFEEPENVKLDKVLDALWIGFENTTKRPVSDFSPTEKATTNWMDVVAKNDKEEYVCCARVYVVSENKLAYMEPLATIKEYRNKGIGSAVVSELYRRTSELGVTHMTGGYNKFYYNLKFEPLVVWTTWKK